MKTYKLHLMKGYKGEKIRRDDEIWSTKCRALYIINRRDFVRYHPDTVDLLLQTDLHFICQSLKRKSKGCNFKNYKQIARKNIGAYATVQYGEIKFNRWSNWVFDPYFKVVDKMERTKNY